MLPRPGEPLTLAHCVYLALRNNPQAVISWQTARSSAAAVGQARGLLLPQLDFTADAERRQLQVLTEVEDVFLRTTYGASFGVRQVLLDGGARRAALRAAQKDLRVADFLHNSTLLDVALDTEVAYYRLLAARSLLEVAQDTVEQRARHLELARSRRRAGMGRDVEVYQARAEHADAALSLVQARSEVRVARGRLASAMGLPLGYEFEVEPIPVEATAAEREEVEQLLVEAAEKRPRLRAAAAEVMRRREHLRLRRAGRWPEVSAEGSYGWRDAHLLPEERKEWTLGLYLRLPLFTGYRTTYAIRRAEAELDRAIASYHEELRGAELQIWEVYSELVRAEEALEAAAAFVDSAERSLSAVENAYQAGKATIVELIDAQTTLTRARNRRATARLDWHTAIARLERQVGRSWDRQAPREPPEAAEPGGHSAE